MTTTSILHALADRLDQQPNRTTDLATIRGYARSLGLSGDWIGILPAPASAPNSEYAARLRELAGGDH